MARTTRSPNVFFRYQGKERKDVFFRINPQAIRYQQGTKAQATETLGGYFLDRIYSKDPQYGHTLADLTIEGTTGIAYRKELEAMQWIWEHSVERKPDGSPVDIYFYDLIEFQPHQQVVRAGTRAFLILINNFAWDDTSQNPFEIRFSFRAKILRNLFYGLGDKKPTKSNVPSLSELVKQKTDPTNLTIGITPTFPALQNLLN